MSELLAKLQNGGYLLKNPVITSVQSSTKVVKPGVPLDNSKKAIDMSKTVTGNNTLARQAFQYYNPPIIKNISSGSPLIDFAYKNQGLMDIPLVGDLIKQKAYDIAKNSAGMGSLDNDAIGKQNGNYSGTLPDNETTQKNPTKLLDVYFGKTTLPLSKYKPSSDYMSFLPSYSIKGNIDMAKYKNLTPILEELGALDSDYSKPRYGTAHINSQDNLSKMLGVDLGHYKTGVAYDKERKLPYISISDAWDFEPKSYQNLWSSGSKEQDQTNYIQSSLMHKAGKPFKVYDRFYFDPKTKEYIPDVEKKQRGGKIKTILLPNQKFI